MSLVRLIEAAGHRLKPQGKDLAMRCPFHEGDDTPSFIVTPSKNVWHCFGCQSGGTVIDWVMRTRSVSFRHAVALLSGESPALAAPASRSVRSVAPAFALPADADQAVADARLLCEVIAEYHATLKQSPEALAYLAKRGLNHPALVDTFQLGYANRTLGYRLPEKNRLSGAALRGALQRIGILRASGHEHFNGSLVVPVMGTAGEVAEVYGRKIGTNLRPGTALHLYLPGPHRGVFNAAGLVGQEEVILCEALL
ncbi:MAG: CHC2 zinc finger domain-containing protein, partial [Pseudomonadota bacterium]